MNSIELIELEEVESQRLKTECVGDLNAIKVGWLKSGANKLFTCTADISSWIQNIEVVHGLREPRRDEHNPSNLALGAHTRAD